MIPVITASSFRSTCPVISTCDTFFPIGKFVLVQSVPVTPTLSFLGNERIGLSGSFWVFKLPGLIGEL